MQGDANGKANGDSLGGGLQRCRCFINARFHGNASPCAHDCVGDEDGLLSQTFKGSCLTV